MALLLLFLSGCAAKSQIFLEPLKVSATPLQADSATLLFQPPGDSPLAFLQPSACNGLHSKSLSFGRPISVATID